MKAVLKNLARGLALLLVLPAGLLSAFGRIAPVFEFFAQGLALVPGLAGSYLRVAYYVLTLRSCSWDSYIGVGSFFAHAATSVGRRVGVGAYCVLGHVAIGESSLISSGVQVLSGNLQHRRDQQGRLTDNGRKYVEIEIGPHCWIGAGAVVMGDIGAGATVAPGSVVTQGVPPGASVAGNPARIFWRRRGPDLAASATLRSSADVEPVSDLGPLAGMKQAS